MISKFISIHYLYGSGLALMLQTNYRLSEQIGFGELLVIFYVLIMMSRHIFDGSITFSFANEPIVALFSFIIIFIMTPVTFLSSSTGVDGSSLRDLVAFYFCLIVVLSSPRKSFEINYVIISFVFVLFLTISVQYAIGGSSAWYFSRFSGGAKNPNQLALFLCCAVVLSVWVESLFWRSAIIFLSIYFGFLSVSEAYIAFIGVSFLTVVALSLMPPRVTLVMSPFYIMLIMFLLQFDVVSDELSSLWGASDEGNARGILFLSALSAWSDNFLSLIFGFGAGSFSGFYGPFGGAEAHNTMFDMMSISGIFGFILFPAVPLYYFSKSIYYRSIFGSAVFFGLICFCMFHFVGRHPIFWVTIVLFSRYVSLLAEAGKAKAVVPYPVRNLR